MMNPPSIRVLIVDDHAIVRTGTRVLLAEIDDIEVVGEAKDGQEAVTKANELRPDVILMDLVMPKKDGIQAIDEITASQPEIKIIALSSFNTDDMVFPAMKAGALGYLLKDTDPQDLVSAVRQVFRGEPSLHPKIAKRLLQELKKPAEAPPTPDPLTERELQVLQLVAKGMSNQEISERLHVSEVTVRTHVSRILKKLHIANRVQATLYALREGLASLDNKHS